MGSSNLKVLVLGHQGMLGWVTCRYLSEAGCLVSNLNNRWPNKEFKKAIEESKNDVVINCAAAIPQKNNLDYSINYELPEFLCSHFQGKIAHPSSNIEEFEKYNDEYASSKRRGTMFVRESRPDSIIIKTSTIGPSMSGCSGIWDSVEHAGLEFIGYENHFWNGVTTLEWIKFCFSKICSCESGEFNLTSDCISKYELSKILAEKLQKKTKIIPRTEDETKNICLNQKCCGSRIDQQIEELIQWRKKF